MRFLVLLAFYFLGYYLLLLNLTLAFTFFGVGASSEIQRGNLKVHLQIYTGLSVLGLRGFIFVRFVEVVDYLHWLYLLGFLVVRGMFVRASVNFALKPL